MVTMNFNVKAETKHQEYLHASYVAGRIVADPYVRIEPTKGITLYTRHSPITDLDRDLAARDIINTCIEIGKKPTVNFAIEGKPYDIKGTITSASPYSGGQLKVIFGPFATDLIQNAYDELKKFMRERKEDFPSHGEGIDFPHFHVTVEPTFEIFMRNGPELEDNLERILSQRNLEKMDEIVTFNVCGYNGYVGKLFGLSRDGAPYGVLEVKHHDRNGRNDLHRIYRLRQQTASQPNPVPT